MVDFYTEANDVAVELVEEFGRDIVINQYDGADQDTAKPHRGQSDTPTDTATVKGVIVSPSDAAELGIKTTKADLVDRLSQVAIVAAGSADAQGKNLREFSEVVDSDQTFEISEVQELRPGSVRLLYYIFMSD